MMNHFLSRFDADNLRKTVIYFVIALLLIIISLLWGITDTSLPALMFPCGIAFLFYSLLRPWGNAKFYGIMSIILFIFLALFLGVGIGILEKINSKFLSDVGETVFLIGLVGLIAGVIGIFRFRKYD
jgi:hypothetical protein